MRKGFQHENLPSDCVSLQELREDRTLSLYHDGFFLLLRNLDDLMEVSSFLRKVLPKAPVTALCDKMTPSLDDLLQDGRLTFVATRPFHFRVIARDMKYAIFHSKEPQDQGKFIVRDIELDLLCHSVTHKGVDLHLRNKEFALLHFMMANTGRVLSRATILENVWDHNANFLTNTVDVHVSQLRKKIDMNAEKKYIHTIPCTGYLFA